MPLHASDLPGIFATYYNREQTMAFVDRIPLIRRLEELRESTVLCYLTSVRPNLPAQMAEDAVRVFFDQMLLLPRPLPKIDVFLCSNGGASTVPWRLVSLLREYGKKIGVLLPFRAYSAATLFALGADEIVMHPFAEMGPIDPTVTNAYNPIDPNTRQLVGISVEDVKAYIHFIKSTVGIQHEDELVRTIEVLAQKVHPLALGNVERFISQSRLIARKILRTHMTDEGSTHAIDEIIENMASKLYFHGHPINRKEARDELGLKVAETISPEVETTMWQLYEDFEKDLENRSIYDPLGEVLRAAPALALTPVPGMPMPVAIIPPGTAATMDLRLAFIESARLSSSFRQSKRFVVAGVGQALEPMIRDETLAQGWEHFPAPRPAVPQPPNSEPGSGVQAATAASAEGSAPSGQSSAAGTGRRRSSPRKRSAA